MQRQLANAARPMEQYSLPEGLVARLNTTTSISAAADERDLTTFVDWRSIKTGPSGNAWELELDAHTNARFEWDDDAPNLSVTYSSHDGPWSTPRPLTEHERSTLTTNGELASVATTLRNRNFTEMNGMSLAYAGAMSRAPF